MRRRDLVMMLSGAVIYPLAANAQPPALPVIGYLSSRSPGDSAHIIAAFRRGLRDAGFVEEQNVTIEYRFAEGHSSRLPSLAGELVRRRPVNVVVATGGTSSAVAARPVVPAAIPMVFAMGGDPVRLGIVSSLARPGGNITGVSFLVNGLAALAPPPVEEAALGVVGDHRERAQVTPRRLLPRFEPTQQIGARGVPHVMAVDRRTP